MVLVGQPFTFKEDDPRPMLRHLDAWARRSLDSPEAWSSMLERCDQWLDYSPRNQVLLASYGVVGPIAGVATWDRVPSNEAGRGCAVRSGEHGLPVRVPVVGESSIASSRSRGKTSSESVAGGHRWELVFAEEQLARRPATGALASAVVPRMSEKRWNEVVRQASGRMTGRTPRKVSDPNQQLIALAASVPPGAGRPALDGVLAEQAASLAAGRVGMTDGPMPAFDPDGLTGRERWRTLVDVRHAATRVVDALSFAVEVELRRSPLPRHEVVDDRTVAAGRRNYLAPADLRALPLGVWIEAGPYSKGEWLARGIAGADGVGAFMRVNDRSYLATYEARGGAMWRLETTGRGAHLGLVGEGVADSLVEAKAAVRDALRDRFPAVALSVESSDNSRVVSPGLGWAPLAGGRDDRTEHRSFDERVSAIVNPGPGGRWESWVAVDGVQRQGPLTANASAARDAADGIAMGALIELASIVPQRANAMVADATNDPASWNRETLVSVIGHRLTDVDRAEMATTDDPVRLTELMADVGVLTPSTMLGVLHAENTERDTAIRLVPVIGLPIPDAIRQIYDQWGGDRLDIGMSLGATVEELRSAGCSRVEMLAASPREELRRLDTREHTWMMVGPTLLEAGYTEAESIAHLAAHAPTPETFAAGVEAVVDNPCRALALAASRARPDDLAALTERFEMSPSDSAAVLAAVGASCTVAVQTIGLRCDGDLDATCEIASRHLGIGADEVEARLSGIDPNVVVPIGIGTSVSELAALRSQLPKPDVGASVSLDSASLQAALQDLLEQSATDTAGVELERVT